MFLCWSYTKSCLFIQKRANKLNVNRNLSDSIYPIHAYIFLFSGHTVNFVEKYIEDYYGQADLDQYEALHGDTQLVEFYAELTKNLGIDQKYKLKPFNIINILSSIITSMTIWDNHLSGSVSFEYLIDPSYTGLKIINNDKCIDCNTEQTFMEYCLVSLSKGWNLMRFDGTDVVSNQWTDDLYWSQVLLDDEHFGKHKLLFKRYFDSTSGSDYYLSLRARIRRMIVPYTGCDTTCCGSSIMM